MAHTCVTLRGGATYRTLLGQSPAKLARQLRRSGLQRERVTGFDGVLVVVQVDEILRSNHWHVSARVKSGMRHIADTRTSSSSTNASVIFLNTLMVILGLGHFGLVIVATAAQMSPSLRARTRRKEEGRRSVARPARTWREGRLTVLPMEAGHE